MQSERPRLLMIKADGKIVGSVEINLDWAVAEVEGLLVARPWRRCGIGQRLIRRCIRNALAAGCRAIRLEVRADNRAALTLYRKLGFAETARYGAVVEMQRGMV